jgi:hypothetical protein
MRMLTLAMCCLYGAIALAQEPAATQTEEVAAEKPQASVQPSAPSSPRTRANADRLDLETTIVTGNRELPKVLYIVPWKKAEIGDLPAQPFNTLLDEVLAPVDRDVFKREVKYYQTVTQSATAAPNAGATK